MPLDTPPVSLDRLFRPGSIAVVGASPREETFGFRTISNLRMFGFPGPIYPVNPRYDEIDGLHCYRSLDALPEPVDLVYLAVAAARGPAILEEAGRCGVGGAVVTASGYIDGGDEGAALQRELEDAARTYGIAVCGPNNMGFINLHDRVVAWPATLPEDQEPGHVALVTQSGSVGIALTQDDRALGIAYMVTAGNEATLTAADYLDYFVRDHRVRIIQMFLETIREPVKFARAAAEAWAQGKRIIAVKVGRSDQGRRMVAAHTGALAGEDAVYDAFFRKRGIIRAADLDSMIEATALVAVCPDPPPAATIAPVTLSGGEAALVADIAADAGVDLPELAPETVARLRAAFPAFATPRNPVDAYGLGWDTERFANMIEALLGDPKLGMVALCMDSSSSGGADVGYIREMAAICGRLAPTTDKKILYINNTSVGGMDQIGRAHFESVGVPCLIGMREGFAAVAEWTRLVAPKAERTEPEAACAESWRASVVVGLTEPERFELLREAGLPMAPCRVVDSVDSAVAAAQELGFPIALKGAAPGLFHKTEHDLIRLGLVDADAAHERLSRSKANWRRWPSRDPNPSWLRNTWLVRESSSY